MCWGERFFSTWKSIASKAIANGASNLLAYVAPSSLTLSIVLTSPVCSFNEPDMDSQANMTPSQAAAYYKEYMNPFAGKASLGSPAVTNSGNPGQGLDWLGKFLDACNGECEVDFFAVHWYDASGNFNYFKEYMEKACSLAAGKPVWITEFAMINAPQEKQAQFIKKAVPWLESQECIARYAYFGVFDGMMIEGSSLSASGKAYADISV
jgi:hypothetical protein